MISRQRQLIFSFLDVFLFPVAFFPVYLFGGVEIKAPLKPVGPKYVKRETNPEPLEEVTF